MAAKPRRAKAAPASIRLGARGAPSPSAGSNHADRDDGLHTAGARPTPGLRTIICAAHGYDAENPCQGNGPTPPRDPTATCSTAGCSRMAASSPASPEEHSETAIRQIPPRCSLSTRRQRMGATGASIFVHQTALALYRAGPLPRYVWGVRMWSRRCATRPSLRRTRIPDHAALMAQRVARNFATPSGARPR